MATGINKLTARINTVLDNLKTSLGDAYHAFNFAKYGIRYLGAFIYRFNRRFHFETLSLRLLISTATIGPRPACWLRQAEKSFFLIKMMFMRNWQLFRNRALS